MTDTMLLRRIISEKGLKLNFIAKELGLSPYGLARKIDNETEFKTSEVDALCRVLDIHDLATKEEIFFAKKVDLKSI